MADHNAEPDGWSSFPQDQHMSVDNEASWCVPCKLQFKSFEQLRQHKMSDAVHKRLYCAKCDKDFQTEDACDNHHIKFHPAEQNLDCPSCGTNFTRLGALMHHLESKLCPGAGNVKLEKLVYEKGVWYNNSKNMMARAEYGKTAGDFTLDDISMVSSQDTAQESHGGVPLGPQYIRNSHIGRPMQSMQSLALQSILKAEKPSIRGQPPANSSSRRQATGKSSTHGQAPKRSDNPGWASKTNTRAVFDNDDLISMHDEPLNTIPPSSSRPMASSTQRSTPALDTTNSPFTDYKRWDDAPGPDIVISGPKLRTAPATTTTNQLFGKENVRDAGKPGRVLTDVSGTPMDEEQLIKGILESDVIKNRWHSTGLSESPAEFIQKMKADYERRQAQRVWDKATSWDKSTSISSSTAAMTTAQSAKDSFAKSAKSANANTPSQAPSVKSAAPTGLASSKWAPHDYAAPGQATTAPKPAPHPFDPKNPSFNVKSYYNPYLEKYKCPHRACTKSCETEGAFIQHLLSSAHCKNYQCKRCLSYFATLSALTQHSEAQSTKCIVRQTDFYSGVVDELTGGIAAPVGLLRDSTVRYAINNIGDPETFSDRMLAQHKKHREERAKAKEAKAASGWNYEAEF
ncbi:hypothetical protein HYFRA_00009029 [Hymenoscyphus fraxineus]|uniref:C2H2-type domain-containing protein n=1 Tax=Hymenoscyphus fraxineus TaxID=746836 RepID=A0A9N9KRX1_9HELO|nr:hypothetical protein HYFRA_00009029 [Hymenoscyphus fraxineus]